MQGNSSARKRSHPEPRKRRCLLKGCDQHFHPTHSRQRYCREECRAAARRSARLARQPGLLPISAPQDRTDRPKPLDRRVPRPNARHAFGADDGKPTRTPAAWTIQLGHPHRARRDASAVDGAPRRLISVPSPVLSLGQFKQALLGRSCQAPKPSTGMQYSEEDLCELARRLSAASQRVASISSISCR